MKKILLTKNKFVLVDSEDFERISLHSWCLSSNGYAKRGVFNQNKTILMHREVMNLKAGIIDHINGDKLDNRKSNLRLCTISLNGANTRIASNNTSGYKGVHWDTRDKKWLAKICVNQKSMNLGRYENKMDAAVAYNEAAKVYFGEFARLNNV